MCKLFFVLWVYSALPWGFHGVLIGPGWASVMIYDDYGGKCSKTVCEESLAEFKINKKTHAKMCLPANVLPNGKIAEAL